eukprot:scaffold1549_cov350-Prasinococcus_capsulatus_cf.AAC.26
MALSVQHVSARATGAIALSQPRLPRRMTSGVALRAAPRSIGSSSSRSLGVGRVVRAQSAPVETVTTAAGDVKLEDKIVFSGLQGKALNPPALEQLPSKAEVRQTDALACAFPHYGHSNAGRARSCRNLCLWM